MVNIPKQNLRTPGPTPVPSDIVEAMSNPMIDHRGPEFHEIIEIATQQLKQVFMTTNDLMILTASGTGALEAAIVNTLSPGDKVLSASAGSFGDRFTEMVETFGADVQRLDFEWGSPIEPEAIRSALRADPGIKAVLVTHNETSTGVTHPLQQISEVVKGEFQKLLLVDAVSSLACVPLPVDGWNCDVVGTASQKGFMIPPGLAFITMSETAWEASETSTMPSFYFDLKAARSYLELGQTPFTPNVALMYGLITALDKLLEEGMENVYERHARISQITRDGIKDLGLDLLVSDEAYASNTVTAIKVPEGVDAGRLRSLVREEHNVVLAGGQGKLSGSIFRIGHLGYVTREDIEEVLETLKTVLPKVGFRAG
ncbi:MAG: alanine--glyoxylate aminotransferase family protein [Chloroflexota bacterium]|nr:alanine--glyoxylate aminotransferase family protein [Chloroflexota bacterium]